MTDRPYYELSVVERADLWQEEELARLRESYALGFRDFATFEHDVEQTLHKADEWRAGRWP